MASNDEWWLVAENWPTAHPTGVVVYPYHGTRSQAALQGVIRGGPFKTKAEADASITKHQKETPHGSTVTYSHESPQQQAGVPGLSNPLSGIDQIGADLEAFYKDITDGKMWRSLGWLVLGLTLVIAGIFLWLKGSNLIPDVMPIPV